MTGLVTAQVVVTSSPGTQEVPAAPEDQASLPAPAGQLVPLVHQFQAHPLVPVILVAPATQGDPVAPERPPGPA